MHFVKSSYVQMEINMSEGLMNIDLLYHIPGRTYQQHIWMEVLGVAAVVAWSHLVVDNSSF